MQQALIPVLATLAYVAACADEPPPPATSALTPPESSDSIESITLHPLFAAGFTCQNHWEGQLQFVGDALGADCLITDLVETEDVGAFSRYFKTNGTTNEDWFSWRAEVLAPVTGTVSRININPVTNEVGFLGQPPASFLIIERADGLSVLIAHVRELSVEQGAEVQAGQPIAKVGNNGFSRTPHIHIGAWAADGTPRQIQFDLRAHGALMQTEG
ncbi:MAG: M23 family metallopeptidase [Pseudomonadota bacterium]